MSQDQKFNQLWEFRRRDDEIDSSDDSKSNSQFEPILKKHKLVSNLILPREDETSDSQKNPQFDPNMGSHSGPGKKTRAMKSKQKKGGNRKKKCSVGSQDLASMDGLKSFAESILEELRVERAKMFERMKEEMKDCASVELVKKPTRKRGGGARKKKVNQVNPGKKSDDLATKATPDCNNGSLERSVISNNKTLTDSNNCQKVVDGQVNHEPITPSEENQNLPIKKSNYSSNEIVSSSYLTLPSILPEPQRSLKKVEVNANGASENFERGSSRNGEDLGFYDQQFGTFGQMCSKDLGFYEQQSVQITSMSNGFPIPLHQRLDSGFSNRNTSNNLMGLRMNGNMFTNNFRGYMNHKVDGRVLAFGKQDLKDGQFYPK